MEDNNKSEPATKSDLAKLGAELKQDVAALDKKIGSVETALRSEIQNTATTLRSEMREMKTELRSEMQEMKTELRTEIQSVKTDVKRLEEIVKTNTIDILNIKENIRDIRDSMSTKDDISRVMNAIDKFAAESASYRNRDTLRGDEIMKHGDLLNNHENRLQKLETH